MFCDVGMLSADQVPGSWDMIGEDDPVRVLLINCFFMKIHLVISSDQAATLSASLEVFSTQWSM